ncbi:MAG: pilin [Clostridia bacterium]
MPDTQLVTVVSRLTSLLVTVSGGLFTLVMVYGGIRYMVASSPRSVEAAKSIMMRAAVGLLLVMMVDVIKSLLQFIAS